LSGAYWLSRRQKELAAKNSTDPQSAATTEDGTSEETLQAAGPLDKGAKEALSGDSCSGEETGTSEHSILQLTLPERIASVGHIIETLQKEVENVNPSVRKGLQKSITDVVQRNTELKNSLRNIKNSQQLLPENQLPFPDTPTFQHFPTFQQKPDTTWSDPYITVSNASDTSALPENLEKKVHRIEESITRMVKTWRVVP
jgi:hypothetical protein